MNQAIANPRLIDVFGIEFSQEEVDFAIPKMNADTPLYVDPFLLWISSSPAYKQLHIAIMDFMRTISELTRNGRIDDAARLLAGCEEPHEMKLGYSSSSYGGRNIGPALIRSILQAHESIPQLREGKMRHLEELQLVIPKFAEDRTSDTVCAIIKQFFLEYTAEQASRLKIPVRKARIGNVYDHTRQLWVPAPELGLPFNPFTGSPILFVPLDMLRRLPWINYDDYYRHSFASRVAPSARRQKAVAKEVVLAFNERNYVEVERYVSERERIGNRCAPDPLFTTLANSTLQKKFRELQQTPTGAANGSDRRYEDLACDLLSTLLYPQLEFAQKRQRTISGAHIRDLIFYNDAKTDFWRDIRDRFAARQPVFELKNVRELVPEHVNQLYRYLDVSSDSLVFSLPAILCRRRSLGISLTCIPQKERRS